MLLRTLYTSVASEGVGIRDAYDIIRVAHNRNSQAGITGGLLLIDGHFIQLLEGLPSAVESRLKRIEKDPRHSHMSVRFKENVEKALFESEWMALRDGSKIDPALLKAHNYEVGLPASKFSSEQVLDLLVACISEQTQSTGV